MWMQTVGKDHVEKAFEYARKYAPANCKLFYNDYNEYEDKKSELIIEILTDLKSKGLVDGMGMQSHWTLDYPSISMFESAVKKYDALGLEVQITELDIKNPDNNSSALERQATRYKQFATTLTNLKNDGLNITALIFWGITDTTSWLGGYPLLFDGQYKAKPAYYSMIEDIPILSPLPTATPIIISDFYVIGDLNDDGKVSSTDFAALRRHILGIKLLEGEALRLADINVDGKVNSTDYSLLRRIILGLN